MMCHSCQLSQKIRETPGFQDKLPKNMEISQFFAFRKIFPEISVENSLFWQLITQSASYLTDCISSSNFVSQL